MKCSSMLKTENILCVYQYEILDLAVYIFKKNTYFYAFLTIVIILFIIFLLGFYELN